MVNSVVGLLGAARRQVQEMKKDVAELRRLHLHHKYDPEQPRVPSGEPDAGQWTSSNGNENDDAEKGEWRSAMARKNSAAFCERQYQRDVFQCKMVGLPGCYSQAMQRYAACLAGTQIPPFNY